jgi:G3E family GTPase
VNPRADGRVPLTIVTGFLGSGKTTLIRRLLADDRFANAAIIVNEFGESGIDHHLLRKTEERITLLHGGCACCGRRDDLVDALRDLIRRRDRGAIRSIDRVVLETTGLADPAPILHTVVADPLLSRRYYVETTIATVDAVAGERNIAAHGEAVRQIAAVDVVALTKGDLAGVEAEARLRALVGQINPAAGILNAGHGRIDVEQLMCAQPWNQQVKAPRVSGYQEPPLLHASAGRVDSLLLSFADQLDWPMLGLWLTMLLHRHGDRILRVKGLLDVGGDGPVLLEGVQHVVHAPRHLPAWPTGERWSRLVFITRDLERNRIAESLAAFQEIARTQ